MEQRRNGTQGKEKNRAAQGRVEVLDWHPDDRPDEDVDASCRSSRIDEL